MTTGPKPSATAWPTCCSGRLDGETIPRRLLRGDAYAAVRPHLARRLGEVLARMHRVDPGSVPGLRRIDALREVTGMYERFAEPRPALEIGLRWLAGNRPPAPADALVHGDFRTGNLIVSSGGLRGVLDWELAHRGDPMLDLGWLCTKAWRFGSAEPRRRVRCPRGPDGGLRRRRRRPPGRGHPAVVGAVRHRAVGSAVPSAGRAVSVGRRAVDEFAVLGRRVCEQEYDVLLALGHAAPVRDREDPLADADAAPPGNTGGPVTAPHDPPNGPGLLRRPASSSSPRSPGSPGLPGRIPAWRFMPSRRTPSHRRARGDARRRARARPPGQARRSRLRRRRRAVPGHQGRVARSPLTNEVVAAVRAMTVDKLAVAHPGHLARLGEPAEGDEDVDFTLPEDLRQYQEELDEFIEREIRPLEQADDNVRFLDDRREDARTDWDRGRLPDVHGDPRGA